MIIIVCTLKGLYKQDKVKDKIIDNLHFLVIQQHPIDLLDSQICRLLSIKMNKSKALGFTFVISGNLQW